jgi:hypothetical protein
MLWREIRSIPVSIQREIGVLGTHGSRGGVTLARLARPQRA